MSLKHILLEALKGLTAPVPTSDLIALVAPDYSNARSQVWSALKDLAQAGIIEKLPNLLNTSRGSRVNNKKVTGWRIKK